MGNKQRGSSVDPKQCADPKQRGPQTAWRTSYSVDPKQRGPQTAWTPNSADPKQRGPQTAWTPNNVDPKQCVDPKQQRGPQHSLQQLLSKWGSRLDIRLKSSHGWRAGLFQNGALALAPRTFVRNTHTESGSFSKWGSRHGAAGIRLESLQQPHGSRGCRFQDGALALAPRTTNGRGRTSHSISTNRGAPKPAALRPRTLLCESTH